MGLGAVPGVEPLELAFACVGGERAVTPLGILTQFRLLTYRAWGSGHDDPHVSGPAIQTVPTGAATQQPGDLGDLATIRSDVPVGVDSGGPCLFGDLFDAGAGPRVDGPADRVLDAAAPPAMLFERVQPGEVVDHIVGGASPVDRDQHVPAVWGWDLFQGGIQALSRSHFAKIIPPEKSGEYFGLFDICGKGASFLGTMIVSVGSQLTGSANVGIGMLALLFAVGFVLFRVSCRTEGAKQV